MTLRTVVADRWFDVSSPRYWLAVVVLVVLLFESVSQLGGGRGPRRRLTREDWNPHGGWLLWVATVTLGLLYGSGWTLFGVHQSHRAWGLLAVAGGLALGRLLRRYLKRPVVGDELDPLPAPPFPKVLRGYDRAAVGELFDRITFMTAADIDSASFPRGLRGYDTEAVDRAMDRWRDRPSSDNQRAAIPNPHISSGVHRGQLGYLRGDVWIGVGALVILAGAGASWIAGR